MTMRIPENLMGPLASADPDAKSIALPLEKSFVYLSPPGTGLIVRVNLLSVVEIIKTDKPERKP